MQKGVLYKNNMHKKNKHKNNKHKKNKHKKMRIAENTDAKKKTRNNKNATRNDNVAIFRMHYRKPHE